MHTDSHFYHLHKHIWALVDFQEARTESMDWLYS